MGPTLGGPFREVVGLGSVNICMGDRYRAVVDLGRWLVREVSL